ncbi:inner membrane-spanning protein YciB [Asticcacaulis sp. 201]|uniref:inner membrane-spanning protein YciB n=1 Tax=Asticcacaulis sp. 201 TaxID=3028787 RepID=UPI00291705DC|nr:septation protein IspZ [Asticcacaulis sp. 201]MDV6332092.1 septation protein IspZ [Asticcacaulis sp. 201]
MTSRTEPPEGHEPIDLGTEIKAGDQIVDRAAGKLAEKLGEANPELALKPEAPKQNTIKMVVDYGPLVAFGLTFFACSALKLVEKPMALVWASGVLGAASVVALIAGLIMEKRVAWIPLMSCLITIPFSVLTVVFKDPTFVKIKMTIVDAIIGSILLGALVLKKEPLKALLGDSLKLKDAAWPKLTIYYALFYYAMGATNEVIWRTQSDDFWVTWKLVSMIGGPIAFSIVLLPFLMKNLETPPEEKAD